MNATLERLRSEAKLLSTEERETLLLALDFDLRGSDFPNEDGPTAEAEIESAWDDEIQRRAEDIVTGKVNLLSEEEFMSVFDEARSELSARDSSTSL